MEEDRRFKAGRWEDWNRLLIFRIGAREGEQDKMIGFMGLRAELPL